MSDLLYQSDPQALEIRKACKEAIKIAYQLANSVITLDQETELTEKLGFLGNKLKELGVTVYIHQKNVAEISRYGTAIQKAELYGGLLLAQIERYTWENRMSLELAAKTAETLFDIDYWELL